jgi:hypothetical protein
VNLGQSLGELQLRVWELEERLAHTVAAPKYRKGLLAAVRAELADGSLLSIGDLHARLPQFERRRISINCQAAVCAGNLVREGHHHNARYRLP